jgi:hypothetical protein
MNKKQYQQAKIRILSRPPKRHGGFVLVKDTPEELKAARLWLNHSLALTIGYNWNKKLTPFGEAEFTIIKRADGLLAVSYHQDFIKRTKATEVGG